MSLNVATAVMAIEGDRPGRVGFHSQLQCTSRRAAAAEPPGGGVVHEASQVLTVDGWALQAGLVAVLAAIAVAVAELAVVLAGRSSPGPFSRMVSQALTGTAGASRVRPGSQPEGRQS